MTASTSGSDSLQGTPMDISTFTEKQNKRLRYTYFSLWLVLVYKRDKNVFECLEAKNNKKTNNFPRGEMAAFYSWVVNTHLLTLTWSYRGDSLYMI